MTVTAAWIAERIREALPDAEVRVSENSPNHLEAEVTSAAFAGKTLVQQHQMVYACLREQLSTGELHALALKTTPRPPP